MLSWFEAMDTGRHDAGPGGETGHDPHGALPIGEIDLVQRNGARARIDHPDESLGALLQHRRRGHLENRALAVDQFGHDGASKPEALGWIIEGDTDAARARHLIRL